MKTGLSHDSVNQLIPWYAKGTLSADDNATVEEHLKTCAACQSELNWLREVSGAMTDLAREVPDRDLSFAKTLAAVEDWEKSKTPVPFSWLKGWFNAIWNPSVPTARIAFAAQFVLIVALAIYSFVPRQSKPGFTTLSGSEETTGRVRLTVNFAPNTTVEQMGSILSGIGGRIVSGPSASGIYVVELAIPSEKDAEIQTVIDKLRTNNAIRFVERQP